MGIEVLICEDDDFIYHVMESIWEETKEDGAVFDEWRINPMDMWVEIRNDGDRLGLYRLAPYSVTTIDVHAQILPEHRRKFTQEITDAVHGFLLEVTPEEAIKFIAFTPSCYKNVLSYIKKSGWKHEGLITDCYYRNGVLYDMNISGITRKQMQELV